MRSIVDPGSCTDFVVVAVVAAVAVVEGTPPYTVAVAVVVMCYKYANIADTPPKIT